MSLSVLSRPAASAETPSTERSRPVSVLHDHGDRFGRRDVFGPLAGVTGADLDVPLVDGRSVRYANLDYAASAPALEAVIADQQRILPFYASVHRGAGYASAVSTALFEQSRTTIADYVGGRSDDLTIFTRNTTDSLNLLAGAVPNGARVVCLDIEHPRESPALAANRRNRCDAGRHPSGHSSRS